jgi:hypothetical protein
MKQRLFTLALFLLPLFSLAQIPSNNFVSGVCSQPFERNFVRGRRPTPEVESRIFIPVVGICYQKTFTGELSIMYADIHRHEGVSFNGLKVGVESSFNPDNYLIAPKIGFESCLALYSVRANFLTYFQNNTSDLRLLLEIGPSAYGVFTLTYGYCPHLLMDKNPNISSHRVSFTVCLFRTD